VKQVSGRAPELAARFGALPETCFTISPSLVQPTSRGQVSLTSADWRVPPTIDAGLLGTDRDLEATLRATEAARELLSQKAFDGIREAELIPGPGARSRHDLIDFVRTGALSFGHPVGTARMGRTSSACRIPCLTSPPTRPVRWRRCTTATGSPEPPA
jgi:choline dehydrogenase